jgi:hypothetical protein
LHLWSSEDLISLYQVNLRCFYKPQLENQILVLGFYLEYLFQNKEHLPIVKLQFLYNISIGQLLLILDCPQQVPLQ